MKKTVLNVSKLMADIRTKNPSLTKVEHSKTIGIHRNTLDNYGIHDNKLLSVLLDYEEQTGKPIKDIIKQIVKK